VANNITKIVLTNRGEKFGVVKRSEIIPYHQALLKLTHGRIKQSCSPSQSLTKPHTAAAQIAKCSGYHAKTGTVNFKTGNAIFLCPNHVISFYTSDRVGPGSKSGHLCGILGQSCTDTGYSQRNSVFSLSVFHHCSIFVFNHRQPRIICATDTRPYV